MWVNGPLSRQLGIDAGQGEISFSRNKKIGRFIDLAMINFGGYDIKKNRMGTFGYLSSWAMAEDKEALSRIGWEPYHVQKGYGANENTITAASSLNWGNNLTPATSNADKILELMAWDAVEKEQFALGAGTPFVYRTIFITEYVARDLAKKYNNKGALEKALIKIARRPLEERAYANYWANPGSSFENKNYSLENHKSKIAKEENSELTPTPKWLSWIEKSQIETVPVIKSGKTAFVVTGDSARNKVLTVLGGGMTTVKIELPDNWDSLMKDIGYKPLSTYYIKPTSVVQTFRAEKNYKPENNINAEDITSQVEKNYSQSRNTRQYEQSARRNEPSNNAKRRPSPEQYRKIRQQQGKPIKTK